ncbi:MAG: redox-regulated ATPase YchF [Desulfovibrionaceae bacterium]
MSLSLGIVGLPNVGKSTLFNALTKAQKAEAANYPFCTVEPNKATVPVPDDRLRILEEIVSPQRVVHATVDFVDIAGLVKGASKGEGLGNAFLATIRECSAIVHVVRCFDDENIIHVNSKIDPIQDIETIELELLFSDIQSLEKRLEKVTKQAKLDKIARQEKILLEEILLFLQEGNDIKTLLIKNNDIAEYLKSLNLLTMKEVIYCMNVSEDGLTEETKYTILVEQYAKKRSAKVVRVCAVLEEELQKLSDIEYLEIIKAYSIDSNGLAQIIKTGYSALGLISYFTVGEKEVRAWTIHEGSTAPQAAAAIHTDFQKGFIRAEVIRYEDFVHYMSEASCRSAGLLKTEGKEYIVKDADIIHFLFNV